MTRVSAVAAFQVAGLALGQAAVSRRMAGPWGAEQAAEFVSGMGPKSR